MDEGRAQRRPTATAIRTSSPAASGSASASPARSPPRRTSSSATSRSLPSTSPSRRRSSTCCSNCRRSCSLTYLFIAHDLSMVRYISTRVAVMYLGKLMELTTSAALYEQPAAPLYAGAALGHSDPRPAARARSASACFSRATCRAPPTRRPAAISARAARSPTIICHTRRAGVPRGRGRALGRMPPRLKPRHASLAGPTLAMRYIIRRLLQAIVVVFGVSIAAFGMSFLTGDPTEVILGDGADRMSVAADPGVPTQDGLRPALVRAVFQLRRQGAAAATSAIPSFATSRPTRSSPRGCRRRSSSPPSLSSSRSSFSIPFGVLSATRAHTPIDYARDGHRAGGPVDPELLARASCLILFFGVASEMAADLRQRQLAAPHHAGHHARRPSRSRATCA